VALRAPIPFEASLLLLIGTSFLLPLPQPFTITWLASKLGEFAHAKFVSFWEFREKDDCFIPTVSDAPGIDDDSIDGRALTSQARVLPSEAKQKFHKGFKLPRTLKRGAAFLDAHRVGGSLIGSVFETQTRGGSRDRHPSVHSWEG
jgi:hypothetical protein